MNQVYEWRLNFKNMLLALTTHNPKDLVERNIKISGRVSEFLAKYPGLWLTFPGGDDEPSLDLTTPAVQFAYPRVVPEKAELFFYSSNKPNPLWIEDRYLTREPNIEDSSWEKVLPEALKNGTVQGILIPALAYDHSFYRLGRGSGFYERYLKDHNILKVGVVFHEQFVEAVPGDDNDINADVVITDKELRWNPNSETKKK